MPLDNGSIFISKNGKVTKRKHSLSGGSVGLFEGKRIGRAKNLEKLQKEIKEINTLLFQSQKKEKTLSVKVPAGVDNGNRLRIKAKGDESSNGGEPGDLYVVINIASEDYFKR